MIRFALTALSLLFCLQLHAERSSAPFETTGTMRDETRYVIHCLETQHYLNKPLSEMDMEKLIENYISDLDPQRLFFLQSDVDGYKERFSSYIDVYLYRGRLYPAFVIFEDYRDRVLDRVDWLEARLEAPFNFTTDEVYEMDRSEAAWPSNEVDAEELWERRLHYQMLNRILSDLISDDEAPASEEPEITEEIMNEAMESIRKRYARMAESVEDIEATEVQEIFLSALTHLYDPHSSYFSADSLEEFAIGMRNSLVGIGAQLSMDDGYCTIRELLPGGPAERSRLLNVEDKIVGVGQGEDGEFVDIVGMKLMKIVKMIRGKKGTIVRLNVRPAGGDPADRKVVSLMRDEVKLTANLARAEVFEVPMGNQTVPVGVIDLPAFYGSGQPGADEPSTTRDVKELIGKLNKIGVEGIVLDLRRNGGGLLSEAINLTGLFIPDGPVVQVRNFDGQIQGWEDRDASVTWHGPLIVLVSRFSASASEIVAGALKNHGRAVVVGDEETHGKGTVQAIFEMNRSNFLANVKPVKGAAKVTVQKYYLPDGTSTQIKGVSSDIILPSANRYLPIGEGDLPNALAWDAIDELDWDYSTAFEPSGIPVSPDLVEDLRTRSAERQTELEEFHYLNESIDWVRKRQEQETISLNLMERISLRAQENEVHDNLEAELRVLAESDFTSEEVLLKLTEEQNAEHEAYLAEREAERVAEKAKEEALTTAMAEQTPLEDALPSELSTDEETSEEDLPSFDIHLRESLRIMADWIDLNEEHERSAASL
ncbi:MAG: carboxy terminal-processing peptidase, partial [Verrucomicrobiota bacterium]